MNQKEFQLFREYIEDQCGIFLGDDKAYLIESRLSRLLVESGLPSFDDLYHHIYTRQDRQMAERIIDAITTNETLWFRDRGPWLIMEKYLLAELVARIRSGKRRQIRIWSAACSTGQEPYSIAMLIENYLDNNNIKDIGLRDFDIQATDISGTVLHIAQLGRYDNISIMRGLDPKYLDRYFKQDGRTWSLDDKIKKAVQFRRFNLQDSFGALGVFDVIFIRNVLLYFSDSLKQEIMKKAARSLTSDGYMFIGSSEIVGSYREFFDQIEIEGQIAYKVKG